MSSVITGVNQRSGPVPATGRRLALVNGSVSQDGKECVVKEVVPGDSVNSLLSILDVITVSDSSMLGGKVGVPIS